MKLPIPGKPVRGSSTGQPIMALLDLLGRNWAMGIIWFLNNGPSKFRSIQEYCQSISPTTLNTRLKELQKSHLIEKGSDGYQLTQLGNELYQFIEPLGMWARNSWAKKFENNESN
ncbi:helix-turn-helix domain-containing protein [Ekhidna sp. MALMAid0563]|uniref:winged helix-turn-helix transcriptional regulator n=1 Tax=Ekhidna sp. MALMAid0563 TaxID=3143937 RepID=UPI0032DFD573